jgi:SET domain-containing protein
VVKISEMESWTAERREKFMGLAYQLDDEHMAGFEDESLVPYDVLKENFVNHSCDGNCWYDGIPLVSRRDIKKGEEIAYDYALTDAHSTFRLNCLCGTPACRGVVTGDDWKKPELQERYGRHFMPHILALIDAEKK